MKYPNKATLSTLLVALSLAAGPVVVAKSPYDTDLDPTKGKVLDCSEIVMKFKTTEANANGEFVVVKEGRAKILDFGNAFMAMSPDTGASAFSGLMDIEPMVDTYQVSHPIQGVSMFRGNGVHAGEFTYSSDKALIAWNCTR